MVRIARAVAPATRTVTTTNYVYNARNQLVTETAVTGTTTVQRLYAYDKNGNNTATGANPLSQGGFETPNMGNGNYSYNPTGSDWTFDSSSGISANGSALTSGNPNAPQGSQVAVIKETGAFSQTASFTAGTYVVTFQAAQRVNNQASSQTFRVLVDSQAVGDFCPADGSYAACSTSGFALTQGNHAVTFVGLNPNGGDNVAFVDAVAVVPHAIVETTNGTLTKTIDMAYDALNRMTSWSDGTTTATYSHRGIESVRSSKTVGGVTTNLLMEGQREIAEYVGGSLVRSYTYGTYIDEPLGMYRPSQSPLYYTRNGLYNVAALSDSSGAAIERYKYEAFGQATVLDGSGTVLSASAVGNPYAFTGRRRDHESLLMYYRARMYNGSIGRFEARDPLARRLREPNAYEFVRNDPERYVDPQGLQVHCIGIGGGATVLLGGEIWKSYCWDDCGNWMYVTTTSGRFGVDVGAGVLLTKYEKLECVKDIPGDYEDVTLSIGLLVVGYDTSNGLSFGLGDPLSPDFGLSYGSNTDQNTGSDLSHPCPCPANSLHPPKKCKKCDCWCKHTKGKHKIKDDQKNLGQLRESECSVQCLHLGNGWEMDFCYYDD